MDCACMHLRISGTLSVNFEACFDKLVLKRTNIHLLKEHSWIKSNKSWVKKQPCQLNAGCTKKKRREKKEKKKERASLKKGKKRVKQDRHRQTMGPPPFFFNLLYFFSLFKQIENCFWTMLYSQLLYWVCMPVRGMKSPPSFSQGQSIIRYSQKYNKLN